MVKEVNYFSITGIKLLIFKVIRKLIRLFNPGYGTVEQKRIRLVKKYINEPLYKSPTDNELTQIEESLMNGSLKLESINIHRNDFDNFISEHSFPLDYHGGLESGVYYEKLFEHYISFLFLNIKNADKDYMYLDVAGASSPWSKILREKYKLNAFTIDLNIHGKFSELDYYLKMDATKTNFPNNSINAISLQCAYEMFLGNDDISFIKEIARILKPGGKVIISPLYMHTHPCYYATPDFYSKNMGDKGAKKYLNPDYMGIPSSRKYDTTSLKNRVIKTIIKENLEYAIYGIKNKKEIHNEIYLHFVLEIIKK